MAIALNVIVDEQLRTVATLADGTQGQYAGEVAALESPDLSALLDRISTRKSDLSEYQRVGGTLFREVFGGDVLSLLRTAEERARTAHQTLHLRLEMASKWQGLPWEMAWDEGASEFLALAGDKALFRTVHARVSPNPVTQPFQIAVLSATPSDLAPIDSSSEIRDITAALSSRPGRPLLPPIGRATRAELARVLRDDKPGILHLIGHGDLSFDTGILALVDDDDKADWLSEHDLSIMLMGCAHVGLIVINSCWSAASGPTPFSGLGLRLAATRVPAVVGMQYGVHDDSARNFSKILYEQLVQGLTVPDAVQQARKHVAAERGGDERDAFGPVLIARGEPLSFPVALAPATDLPASPLASIGVLPISRPSAAFIPVPGTLALLERTLSHSGSALLSAEGGFGKTETCRAIAIPYGTAAVWIDGQRGYVDELSLVRDIADRAHRAFGVNLTELLRTLDEPGVASRLGRIPGRLTEGLLAALNSMSTDGLLVIDDVHALPFLLLSSTLATLLRGRPPRLRVLLAAGAADPTPLTPLVENGSLRRLDRHHFQFDNTIAREYFRRRFGKDISPRACAEFVAVTEGWPMALTLIDDDDVATEGALDRLVKELEADPARTYDVLLTRAYIRQDPTTRDVLKVLSVTRRITADWLNAVIGTANGGATLRLLSASNAFVVPTESTAGDWRLQTLFRLFLRQRFVDEDGEDAKHRSFMRSYSYWRDRSEFLTAALDALDASYWEEAAGALDRVAPFFTDTGRLQALVALSRRLPNDVTASHPVLSVHVAQALGTLGHDKEAMSLLDTVTNWGDSGVRHFGALVRAGMGTPPDDAARQTRADTLAAVRADAAADGDLLIAAQAALRRADLLTPLAFGNQALTTRLAQELVDAEGLLKRLDSKTAWGIRAHLLATAIRLHGQAYIGAFTAAVGDARIATHPGGPDNAAVAARVVAATQLDGQKVKDLAARAVEAAKRASSELAHADAEYAWIDFVVSNILNSERLRLSAEVVVAGDDRRRDELLKKRIADVEKLVATYERFEMPYNVAMTLTLLARITRMLGDVAHAEEVLERAEELAARFTFADVLRVIGTIRSGLYDYDFVARASESSMADLDDDELHRQAERIVRLLPRAGAPSVAKAKAELDQMRQLHRARREWCRHLDLRESSEESGSRRVICLRFRDRHSQVLAHEFGSLLPAFKRTYCEGCEARDPAPVVPVL